MRFAGPRVHGVLDYVTVVAFLVAPTVLGFTGLPEVACYVLAVVHLVLTMLTDFPLGVRGTVPFRLHRALEFVVGLVLVVAPWILADTVPLAGRIFFSAAGAAIVALSLGTGRTRKRPKKAPPEETGPDEASGGGPPGG